MKDFRGKHVLITGGASGIGFAAARQLVRNGASVMIFDLNDRTLEKALAQLRETAQDSAQDVRCEGFCGDVTDFGALGRAVEKMTDNGMPVDMLINSAGIAHPGALAELEPDIIKKTIDIDLLGTIYACRAVLPGMLARRTPAALVLISSVAGLVGVYGYSAYGAAKFGVRGLGEVLRQELKPFNIEVSVLFPPDTDTPQLVYENQFKPEATRAISGTIKPVSPEYVAQCLLKGLRRGRFLIVPTFTGKLTATVATLFTPFLRLYLDRVVRKVLKKNPSTGSPEQS